MITQGGAIAYARDGKVYEGGLFGGDLEEAVRGNPEAERHAHAYSTGMAGGFAALLLGAAGLVSGIVVTDEGRSHSGSGGNETETAAGTGFLIGGAAAYIAGLVLMLNAQPHQLDAINVYNDGVPEPVLGPLRRPEQLPPAPGSPWAPPTGAEAPPPPPPPPVPPPPAGATPPAAPAPMPATPPAATPAAPGS